MYRVTLLSDDSLIYLYLAKKSKNLTDIHNILKTYWGYSAFREKQEEIIQSVLAGKDTLALLPTGGGKSICFQVPALTKSGVCIVVSPLIALMKDQVEQLKRRQIPAAAIYTGLRKQEVDTLLDNCIYGNTKFLYVSPERLKTTLFIERLKKMNVSLLAVDEAHCISQWGYDFRPAYLEIAAIRELIPTVPCIALTATATTDVQKDIQEKLQFPEELIFQKSFARNNLSYSVLYEENKEVKLVKMLRNVPGTAVVYVRTRKRTKIIAEYLQKHAISADFYHGGLANDSRARKQTDWIEDRIRVMVSTNAFGMGIDKPNVRLVVHLDLPDTLEAYYQEAGRAGRDGKLAYAAVLYNKIDIEELRNRVVQGYPDIQTIKKTYQALANYYKLAVGSGFMSTYNFELNAFTKTYQLDYIPTYHSIKRLEEQGFIQLNEAFYMPSKAMFLVNKQRLYEFQIANAKLDGIIKLMLRMYGGELFNNPVTIAEKQLAQFLNLPLHTIEKQLKFLDASSIIQYTPQNDQAQITFLSERHDIARFPFNQKLFQQRKERDTSKMEAVAHYIEHENRCRTALLLEYFGEIAYQNCGNCDYCVQQKKNKTFTKYLSGLDQKIIETLQDNPLKVNDLADVISANNQTELVEVVREMVDSGELYYNEKGELEVQMS